MRRVEMACIAAGVLLIVTTMALVYWPAAPGLLGAFLLIAAWPPGGRS